MTLRMAARWLYALTVFPHSSLVECVYGGADEAAVDRSFEVAEVTLRDHSGKAYAKNLVDGGRNGVD